MSDRFQLRPTGPLDGTRQVMEQALQAEGFRFTWENPQQGVVEKGSRKKAMLLGAFAIHYKYSVTMAPQNDGTVMIDFGLATSGVSGGAAGMVKVRKKVDELQGTLSGAFQAAGM